MTYQSIMAALIRGVTKLWNVRVLRVAFFGGVGVIVQTIIFETLGVWLDVLRPSLATLLGAECGVLTAFALNNRYSFHESAEQPLLARLARFHVVVSGSLFIQWLFVFAAESYTSDLLIIHAAYAISIIVGFISNYTGYRLWVWRHHAPAV